MINDPIINTDNCSNCGTQLIDKYCYKCGQKKIELKDRTVTSFIVHFFEEFLTFDSKFFRSVKFLILKPGYLTHEYISGRFVRYISPLKMYLFTSLVCFFVIIKVDPDTYSDLTKDKEKDDPLVEILTNARESNNLSESRYEENFNDKVNNLYTPSIFFIMIAFSVMLKLLYVNKHIFYVEHLVFTLHYFSVVLILCALASMLKDMDIDIFNFIVFIVPCFYLLIAVKKVYHTKWIFAFMTTAVMSLVYIILIVIWAISVIAIAAYSA
jgi:hypothetical protein